MEFSSKGRKFSPEFGDIGSELVVRPLTRGVGLWLNLPGLYNRPYYETGHNSAYGADNSPGNCCRFKEKAERKSSQQGYDPKIVTG